MMLNQLIRHTWHGGQLLAFSALDGATDYDQALTARTVFNVPGIDIKLPGSCTIRFPSVTATDNVVTGDCFWIRDQNTQVKGVFLDTYHLLIEGPCEVINCEPAVTSISKSNRTLIGSTSHFDTAKLNANIEAAMSDRCHWLQTRQLPSGISSLTRHTLLKALSIMKTQVYSPEGRIKHRWTTPDRWPHRRMWLWDSVFHAIGWRHIDPEIARDAISAVFDMQQPNGFIGHSMDPSGASNITQPPVLALGAKLVCEAAPNPNWISELYPKLCAYIDWDLKNRDSDGSGLLEWHIEGNPRCRCGESGMDNSPRFDEATLMDAVDFNSYLALECEILAEFANMLSLHEDAEKWRTKHSQICSLISSRLWSDELEFFADYDLQKHAQSPILAISGFLPLICGAASDAQAQCLARHLRDPQMFGTVFPVPSIAAKDTEHYEKEMWRGPVWVNLNWLIADGFNRNGLNETASFIRERTMQEIERCCENYGTLFEFYDDRGEIDPPKLLRKGKCSSHDSPFHQVFHDYGWTASLYADMVYSMSEIKQIPYRCI